MSGISNKKRSKKEKVPRRAYKHVLVDGAILSKFTDLGFDDFLNWQGDRSVTESQLAIILHPDTDPSIKEYYFRLVFTVSFQLYKQKRAIQLANQEREPGTPIPEISIKTMAEEAGIEYFKINRLFRGTGLVENLFKYELFLRRYNIDFITIAKFGPLVDKANKYMLLKKAGIDPTDLSDLKF